MLKGISVEERLEKFNKVNSIKKLSEYQLMCYDEFFDLFKKDIEAKIKEKVQRKFIYYSYRKDGQYLSDNLCPECGKISTFKQSYPKTEHVCECGFNFTDHESELGVVFDLSRLSIDDEVIGEGEDQYTMGNFIDTLFNYETIIDYLEGVGFISAKMRVCVELNAKIYPFNIKKTLKEFDFNDINVDLIKYTNSEIFSYSNKYNFRKIDNLRHQDDVKATLLSSSKLYGTPTLFENYYDFNEEDIQFLIDTKKYKTIVNDEQDHLFHKMFKKTSLEENSSIYYLFQSVKFEEMRQTKKKNNKKNKVKDSLDDVVEVEKQLIDFYKDNFEINSFLYKNSMNNGSFKQYETICLKCGNEDVLNLNTSDDNLVCTKCGNSHYVNNNAYYRTTDTNFSLISSNSSLSFLDLKEVGKNIYDSIIYELSITEPRRYTGEMIEKIIEDPKCILDYMNISMKSVLIARYDGKRIKYEGYTKYSNDDKLSKTHINYGNIYQNMQSVDFVMDKEKIESIYNKLIFNKYKSFDYFVENYKGFTVGSDDYYKEMHFFPQSYASLININPAFELIMKTEKFKNLFSDIYNNVFYLPKKTLEDICDAKAKNPNAALGLTHDDINALDRLIDENELDGYSLSILELLRTYKSLIKKTSRIYKNHNISMDEEKVKYTPLSVLYREKGNNRYMGIDNIIPYITNIVELTPISLEKIMNYADLLYYNQGLGLFNGLSIWLDYLQMAVSLDYNLEEDRVLMPNSLKREHDVAVMYFNKISEKQTEESFSKILSTKKWLEFSDDLYSIILPETTKDVVAEGQNLHHCVGSYVERIARGNTVVMFLRKNNKPSESFYTVEVRDNKVVQVRGLYNESIKSAPSSAERFLKDWAKQLDLKY